MLTLTSDKLPPEAFVLVRGNHPTRAVGKARLGISGYFPVDTPATRALTTSEEAARLVHRLNHEAGVTPLQANCMEIGSMFGWEAGGADPSNPKCYPPDIVAHLNATAQAALGA